MNFLDYIYDINNHLDVVWTFCLLILRFAGLMSIAPGIGQGPIGLPVRMPAVIVLSAVCLFNTKFAPLPNDWLIMGADIFCEYAFGYLIGYVAMLVVSGVQTGIQIASGSMGLGAAQMMDPTTGAEMSDLSRMYGDLVTMFFLILGGHYTMISTAMGVGREYVPGSFQINAATIDLLVERSSHLFQVGIMIAAPVIVSLLLTQFVMALLTKAVPTINVFIISFPLTIGIGLVLLALALPDVMIYVSKEFMQVENIWQKFF